MKLAKILDGIGIYGSIVHFSFAGLFFSAALLIFLYLWRKGKLDMDESPAEQMLEDDPKKNKKFEDKDDNK